MIKYRSIPDGIESTSSKLDAVIEFLLVGLLAFMPLAFGVVHAWSREIVLAICGAIVVCFLLKLIFVRGQRLVRTWAYVPLLLFLLVAAVQLIPLPAQLVRIVSPNTAATKTELLGDLVNADSVLRRMTLSFYANATRGDLRLVLAVAAVFLVVLNVFRSPKQIRRLLTAIAVIGGVVALITLAQTLFGNGKIYWFISTSHSRGYSGPFVNHSHYGQFMNLSIGAALGLVLVRLHKAFRGEKMNAPAVFEYLGSSSARAIWLLVGMIGLGAATVFVSLTRGGMVSLLVAGMFTTLVMSSQRSVRGHSWVMIGLALVAFTCVLYVGFDAVCERMATLRGLDDSGSARVQMLKDVIAAWLRFPVVGTGLGTHSVVYPMFDSSMITALATHAENEYAQVAEETGLIGLGLLVVFGVIVWANYWRNVRGGRTSIQVAAYGLGFGIVAILVHSLVDFGQHLPANSFLTAVSCALLISLARRGETVRRSRGGAELNGRTIAMRCFVLVGAVVVWVWALAGAGRARAAEKHWRDCLLAETSLVKNNWLGTDAEYEEVISHARAAARCEPDNVKYRYWLNVYRWRSIDRMADPDTTELTIADDQVGVVEDIVGELHKARTVCPTYGPAYSIVGQIEKFILNDEAGAGRIRKGYVLAPCDPIACFVAGYLDVSEGRVEDCIEKFGRAVALDGRLFEGVVGMYVTGLSRPDLAISVAGDDIGRLIHVASVLEEMQYDDLAEHALNKAKGLLEAECSEQDASAWSLVTLGDICTRQQDKDGAIRCYRRALRLDYGQVYWRLHLARLLAEAQRVGEAVEEARICLRLRPQFKAAEQLVRELSVHPAILAGED